MSATTTSSSSSSAFGGNVKAMAVFAAGEDFKPFSYPVKALAKNDVTFRVEYCGVCHSDLHTVNGDWPQKDDFWPIVPGHEAVGIVLDVGSEVKHIKVGDRVGLGAQCSSCHKCDLCSAGHEEVCLERGITYSGHVTDETGTYHHYGGYGTAVRTDARFVFVIPDKLPLTHAGPLLCAGITTFSPLRRFGAGVGKNVAVAGIGGLGHLAVKFAVAMGANVTALSGSDAKRELAKELGAHHYVAMNDAAAVKAVERSFDLVLITISSPIDFDPYIVMVKPFGTACFVGLPPGKMAFSPGNFVGRNVNISGSAIGDPATIREMLAFSAAHNVLPMIEEFTHSNVNEAYTRLKANTLRFRAVLKNDL